MIDIDRKILPAWHYGVFARSHFDCPGDLRIKVAGPAIGPCGSLLYGNNRRDEAFDIGDRPAGNREILDRARRLDAIGQGGRHQPCSERIFFQAHFRLPFIHLNAPAGRGNRADDTIR
ncbi:hypothetical protein D3C87_1341460 [compost metagenome]